jgi:hypothetical protein
MVDWLRRSLGGGQRPASRPPQPVAPAAEPSAEEAPGESSVAEAEAVVAEPEGIACPSCAFWIAPPPPSSRLCPRCRERIVVRRSEGRTVYFTEAAVKVFEAERQRELNEQRWTVERREWLRLAKIAGATQARRQRLEDQYPSAEVVEGSKALYLGAVETAVRAARRQKHWTEVARLRREQAAALFAEAGSPVPPPDDIAALHKEAAVAQLRALAPSGTHAELVGAGCCKACRGDDGKAFKIVDELRAKRLPHAACPRGLCACEWWVSVPAPPKRRRRTVKPATPVVAAAVVEPSPSDAQGAPVLDAVPEAGSEP